MNTNQKEAEAVARAWLMADLDRFEEHVLGAFLNFGERVEHDSKAVTEQGIGFLVFSYNDVDLLQSASRILQKSDLPPRAHNAARIAQLLPAIKEALRAGKPSWQFAQMMCRIAGGVPTGGGKSHHLAISNQAKAKKERKDKLQIIIEEIVKTNRRTSARDVLEGLKTLIGNGTIEKVTDEEIEWHDGNNPAGTTPISAVKDRVSRAKKSINSR